MAPRTATRTWSAASIPALLLLAVLSTPSRLRAQEPAAAEEPPIDPLKPKIEWGIEAKANYRDSDDFRFPVKFPFTPEMIPAGQTQVFEQTVNPGQHFEVSVLTLLADARWGDAVQAHAKIDAIDLYDRNPTSTDRKIDVDELWLRFGQETQPATLAPQTRTYLKVGKFAHFERQNDRHLESYGLVSTAFNRFEDIGAELGVDLGRHLYVKVSATQGNPLFMRDPNALAGDNGTPAELREHPVLPLKSGIVILYDAEAEDIDLDGKLEVGGGVGLRFADEAGKNGIDLLGWAYRRTLAPAVALEGTFYGGDLDLLNGPFDLTPLPVKGNKKEEKGGNLWAYWDGLTFFGQYVDQKIAGLPRTGIEGELAWKVDLPLVWAVGDRQLFSSIAPAVRYSKLDNGFKSHPQSPSPSWAWDWRKIDYGLRLGILSGIDLTVEYADNRFILGSGKPAKENELLATLRWKV